MSFEEQIKAARVRFGLPDRPLQTPAEIHALQDAMLKAAFPKPPEPADFELMMLTRRLARILDVIENCCRYGVTTKMTTEDLEAFKRDACAAGENPEIVSIVANQCESGGEWLGPRLAPRTGPLKKPSDYLREWNEEREEREERRARAEERRAPLPLNKGLDAYCASRDSE